jgi:hypothetical protein
MDDLTTDTTAMTLTGHQSSLPIDPRLLVPETGIAFVSRQAPVLAAVSESSTTNVVVPVPTPVAQVNPSPRPLPTTDDQPSIVAPNDTMRLVHGLAGSQFPAESEPIDWDVLGVQVHLPWVAKKNRTSPDAQEVMKLMRYPIATEPVNGRTLIKTLPAPTHTSTDQDMQGFYAEVHKALGNGILVVVRGWRSEFFTDFTSRSLEEAGCSVDQIICAHGTSIYSMSIIVT